MEIRSGHSSRQESQSEVVDRRQSHVDLCIEGALILVQIKHSVMLLRADHAVTVRCLSRAQKLQHSLRSVERGEMLLDLYGSSLISSRLDQPSMQATHALSHSSASHGPHGKGN